MPVGIVESTSKVTTIFVLFTARVHDIEKFLQFLPGYDWRNPTIMPHVRAISSDISSLVPLVGGHKDELRKERPLFYFCAECGGAIESQRGCKKCGTEGVFLFGIRAETIPHLEMAIPQEVLRKVVAGGYLFWWGEGRVIDEERVREIADALVYHPPVHREDPFIGGRSC